LSDYVSIVVPVYNGESYIQDTVKSLLSQTYPEFEILLINDGSSDGSAELIDELGASFPSIRVFHKDNGGVACARNFGIEQAKGNLIAFCDQDDLWLSEKLEYQVPLFANPNVGLVYCGAVARYVDADGERDVYPSFFHQHRGAVFNKLIYENMFTCCTVVARKSAIDAVGGFDDDKELMGVDDWHLWLKIANQFEFDFVEQHLAIHVFHGTNYSSNDEKMHMAELVCLNKIQKTLDLGEGYINWLCVKSEIHKKYAACYLYNGNFRRAGDAYREANSCVTDVKILIKANFLLFSPVKLLTFIQVLKRRRI
jgi:glycosyltransferase involved in cell wall biosynthesis